MKRLVNQEPKSLTNAPITMHSSIAVMLDLLVHMLAPLKQLSARLALSLWLFIVPGQVFAEFSPGSHEIYSGDYNGDGLTDLYLKPKQTGFVIIASDVSIPVAMFSDVEAVLLLGQIDGSYVVNYNLSQATIDTLNTWTVQGYTLETYDHDNDGLIDARIVDDTSGQPIAILLATGAAPTYIPPKSPVTITYEYDDLGRLIDVSDTINGASSFDYDAAGNRTQVSETTASQ